MADQSQIEQLKRVIASKLDANPEAVVKSLSYGRIVWRVNDGKLDVVLELSLK